MPFKATFPDQLPDHLIKLSAAYRIKVTFAILSIVLFFGLFFSLIGFTGYFIKYFIDLETTKIPMLMRIGVLVGLGMLLVFLVKFLFHLKDYKPTNRLEVKQEEEPELWNWILQICQHTGAPKPVKIYLDPDVNAYVRYTHNVRSLIMPVGKELTIGYPLLQALSEAEFQAVMSHEFGHFAQRSMRIGTYVGTANTIISQMINRRDSWDNMLSAWMRIDIRLSFMAWILFGFIWLLRQVMKGFYFLLNVLNGSVSREMEFNADKFAVMSAGSVPIISGLWKLEPCQNNVNQWLNLAFNAHLKSIYSENLLAKMHQDFELLASSIQDKEALLPEDPMGGKKYFKTAVHFKGHMYDSHPPQDEREVSAKSPFVPAVAASNSAYTVLQKPEHWEKELNSILYRQLWNVDIHTVTNEGSFDQFATEEKAATKALEKYHNTFAVRYLSVPEPMELKAKVNEPFQEKFLEELQNELQELMKPIVAFDEQLNQIQSIANGSSRLKKVSVDGKNFKRKNMKGAWELVWKKRDEYLNTAFQDWDKRLCQFIVQKASADFRLSEVLELLEQHAFVVKELRAVEVYNRDLSNRIQRLQAMSQVEQEDVNQTIRWCLKVEKEMNERLNGLHGQTWKALPNLENMDSVLQMVFPDGKISKVSSDLFQDGTFDLFYHQMHHAAQQWLRIEQKSLAAILA